MFVTDRDPRVHRLVDLPVVAAYRRETHIPTLVGYHHQENGKWVLALLSTDEQLLWEVGYLNGSDGSTPEPTQANFQNNVARLRSKWETPAEVVEDMKRSARRKRASQLEQHESLHEAVGTMYRHIRGRNGVHAADEYLQSTGMSLKGPAVRARVGS